MPTSVLSRTGRGRIVPTSRLGSWLSVLLLVLMLLPLGPTPVALAANPAPQQIYYVSLPEDDLLQLFDDDAAPGSGFADPVSPIRSITSISIGSTGTLVYYDQWEDGGYDADIANPTNLYTPSNPAGTQIWGDGNLSNGCPPSINNVINPCLAASDDVLHAGDVIILDNDVAVGGTSPGPYSRNPSLVFYDGRDKFGATFAVAVTRAAFPIAPGSVMAGGSEVLDTSRWGTAYRAPLGENLVTQTQAFEDVRWFIMAGPGGATISVDANGDGDYLDANDLNNVVLAEGGKRVVKHIQVNATLVATNGVVQVNSMTADVNDTFEFRWDALLPRSAWGSDYYSPVGTKPKTGNSGCTEVWIHNPNPAQITVNVTRPGPINTSINIAANSTAPWPASATDLYNEGFRLYTTGSPAPDFLPIQIVDCTKDTSSTQGRLYDWGTPLFPADELTSQVLAPWAPGCTNESFLGICRDADSSSPYTTRDVTTDGSRSVIWVTPLANTTIYVDKDGSGIDCQAGSPTGAEQTINALALRSYRLNDDPTSRGYVRHGFGSGNYTGTDNIGQGWPQNSTAWLSPWTETGENDDYNAGAFRVVSNELRIGAAGGAIDETGWTISRSVNLSGNTYASLRFQLRDNGLSAANRLAVEVSKDGSTWFRLGVFQGDQIGNAFDPVVATAVYNISPYISANTAIRFMILNNMSGSNYWFIDNVHIDYAVGGDWDMTGARIATCDGTKIAASYGQDPELSGSNDDEALDLGTGITPLGSAIAIEKSADKTVVARGGLVHYTFAVTNQGATNLQNVSVTDNRCSPVVYSSGDTNDDGLLQPYPAETWYFICSSHIYFDTTNVAYATGNDGVSEIVSAPDEWTVTVIQPGVIGNYVWLDEDGDGDQDAGEAGIPNVLVTLTGFDDQGNPVTMTTYTDANGGYLFTGLPPSGSGGYTVTITPPAGLHPTYDEDSGTVNPNNTTVVHLAAGDEHLTADFGLNWAPPADTNNPPSGATGAIGDRVWIDADGDGAQDANEVGLAGVTVTLYSDPDGDGVYNTPIATTTTDANGNYIFDDLPPGAYVVVVTPPAGYIQTGDPDQFGVACTTCDNRTTTPVVLGPGDVFVNADFGYQPTGPSGSIGDTVWLDANRNNTQDPGEHGIPGVTVSLIRDLNGNGVWDPGEPIIATDITDENGQYLFSGLPIDDGVGSDDYLVWVNDTNNVLGELAPTYDVRDGANQGNPTTGVVTGLGISAVTDLGATPVTDADFAYAPPGHDAGEGLIGDTIWLDRDGDGQYDPGEGLEGVRVVLTDPGPDGILGTDDDTERETFTDENGNYYFGGLEPSLTYRVTVDTATLPPGVTNTVDPDGGFDSTSVVDLSLSPGGINLDQDFAYGVLEPNTIGGTIWVDSDADGTLDTGEPGRFGGVTVVLYDEDGNVVGTTVTDSNGNYSFTGLPDGTYTVDVTDDDGVLNGYWKSNGPNAGQDNNSQVDPYTVTVGGGQTDTTGDFGYYVQPAALGNRVWFDEDYDGIQDAGEPGIAGVIVTLTITWPNGDTTTVNTVTDANGYYSFGNLLLDEDYNGLGSGQPTYSISVGKNQSALAGYPYVTRIHASGSTQYNDSDDPDGTAAASPVQGQTDTTNDNADNASYDFGFTRSPAAVLLAGFEADAQADHVLVSWETVSEASNAGFNLYRSLTADGEYTLLGFTPSAAPGGAAGAAYSYQDFDVQAGQTYWYRLEDIELSGATTLHDPVSVAFGSPTAVALSGFAGSAAAGVVALSALAGLAAAATAAAVAARRRR